jgi:predicted dehydrogenase
MSDKFRLALIGAGGIAQSYAHALRTSEVAEIVGVADVRPEAAQTTAELLGCSSFASYEKLLEAVACDGAIVCTPPVTHAEICSGLAERGISMLCEKPLALDSESARGMLAEAERAGVTLTMASKFRYVEDIIRAKSLVASGVLGELVYFENTFASRVDMSRRWNSDKSISGGGVLIDNGTHCFDIVRYVLGPISSVAAVEARRVQGLGVEDTVRVLARTAGGVLATIDLSWSLQKDLDYYLELYGSNGTIRVGWRDSKYKPATSPDWIQFGQGYDKLGALRRNVEDFARAVRTGGTPLLTADDALASVLSVEAAYASLATGEWVPVAAAPRRSLATVQAAGRAGRLH